MCVNPEQASHKHNSDDDFNELLGGAAKLANENGKQAGHVGISSDADLVDDYQPEEQKKRSHYISEIFESHAWDEMPDAEVVVHMYNINYNEEAIPVLLRRNPELREYANFIQTARDYACAGMDKEEALRRAINDFAKTDTMGPFLEENASEVVNMLLTEWNTVDYGRVQRAEGRAEGVIQTLCKSLQAVMQNAQLSFERASAMLGLTPEEVEACRAELNQ